MQATGKAAERDLIKGAVPLYYKIDKHTLITDDGAGLACESCVFCKNSTTIKGAHVVAMYFFTNAILIFIEITFNSQDYSINYKRCNYRKMG